MAEKTSFLDKTGVTHLWAHIVAQLGLKADKTELKELETSFNEQLNTKSDKSELETLVEQIDNHSHIYYGVCSTAGNVADKTVSINNFELVEGAMVIIKFTEANAADSPTLNVNDTGAKPMYRYGTTVVSTTATTNGWSAGTVQIFVYDGTGWIRDYWCNNTYSNASLGQGYGTCSTAADTVAKTVSMSSYAASTGGIVSIKFTNDVPANATLNINSKGAKKIYYNGSQITDGVIKAGDTATFIYSTNYYLISIDNSMSKSGGTFTGKVVGQSNTDYTTYQLRNMALSTTAAVPTGTGSILGVY